MDKLTIYSDLDGLLKILNIFYELNLEEIFLYREKIGYVYFARNSCKRYALKLYRHFNTDQALQSVDVIQYLMGYDYPVASIISTKDGSPYIALSAPEGKIIGILYNYIEGVEPNVRAEIMDVGKQIGELHSLMEGYTKPLFKRGKEFFTDRYIEYLRKFNYCPDRIRELYEYSHELWNNIEKLPGGFCHGDLHSGNMLKTSSNKYVLFDFDIVSNAFCIVDVASLSNDTHFNRLEESAYDSTIRRIEDFYKGYSQKRTLSNAELAAIFDFIAVRHYEIIATITECEGLKGLSQSFLDQQYEWLMKWRDICSKRI